MLKIREVAFFVLGGIYTSFIWLTYIFEIDTVGGAICGVISAVATLSIICVLMSEAFDG